MIRCLIGHAKCARLMYKWNIHLARLNYLLYDEFEDQLVDVASRRPYHHFLSFVWTNIWTCFHLLYVDDMDVNVCPYLFNLCCNASWRLRQGAQSAPNVLVQFNCGIASRPRTVVLCKRIHGPTALHTALEGPAALHTTLEYSFGWPTPWCSISGWVHDTVLLLCPLFLKNNIFI